MRSLANMVFIISFGFLLVSALLSNILGEHEGLVSESARLKAHLSKNYDPDENPENAIVYLFFIPTFMQTIEAEETMHLTGKIFIYWRDKRLTWNPEDFNGRKTFETVYWSDDLNSIKLWAPKIIGSSVWGGYDTSLVRLESLTLLVHFDGRVEVHEDYDNQIVCEYDRASFPYDQHNCSMFFYKLRREDAWKYELRSGSITETSIQFQHNAASHQLTTSDFELVEFAQKTWYYNWYNGNFSMELPNGLGRKNGYIIELVRLKAVLKRHAPWFTMFFKAPLLVLLLVTAVSLCISAKNLAVFLLIANILLHALLINSFLSVSRFSESLPNYGWLSATSLMFNCIAVVFRLIILATLYENSRNYITLISTVIYLSISIAVFLF